MTFTRLAAIAASLALPAVASAVCPVIDGTLASASGPSVLTGNTCGFVDDYYASCALGGTSTADDLTYTWTATVNGFATIDMGGSTYDTTIVVYDDQCNAEVACNDDSIGLQSSVTFAITAGTTYVIDLDGYNVACGDFVLNIDENASSGPTCVIDGNLGSATGEFIATANTCGNVNDYSASNPLTPVSCGGGQEGEDLAFTWTAPSTGTFWIDTATSNYDTALQVRDPAGGCATELACDDDGGAGLWSLIRADLTAGDQIVVVADGFASSCGDVAVSSHEGTFYSTMGNPDSTNSGTLFFEARGAAPGSEVFFVGSVQGPGAGICPRPLGGACIDLRRPFRIGTATADGLGFANFSVTVPAGYAGGSVFFQAVYVDRASGTFGSSNVSTRIIQ